MLWTEMGVGGSTEEVALRQRIFPVSRAESPAAAPPPPSPETCLPPLFYPPSSFHTNIVSSAAPSLGLLDKCGGSAALTCQPSPGKAHSLSGVPNLKAPFCRRFSPAARTTPRSSQPVPKWRRSEPQQRCPAPKTRETSLPPSSLRARDAARREME